MVSSTFKLSTNRQFQPNPFHGSSRRALTLNNGSYYQKMLWNCHFLSTQHTPARPPHSTTWILPCKPCTIQSRGYNTSDRTALAPKSCTVPAQGPCTNRGSLWAVALLSQVGAWLYAASWTMVSIRSGVASLPGTGNLSVAVKCFAYQQKCKNPFIYLYNTFSFLNFMFFIKKQKIEQGKSMNARISWVFS